MKLQPDQPPGRDGRPRLSTLGAPAQRPRFDLNHYTNQRAAILSFQPRVSHELRVTIQA
jgi:hypothetical protein